MLKRFRDILIRELANVLGRDRVDHGDRLALQIQSAIEAGPCAGHDDVARLGIRIGTGRRPGNRAGWRGRP
jgi:hypothetical protein